MLRLLDLRLPLDHSDAELAEAIRERLGLAAEELLRYSVYRRCFDNPFYFASRHDTK